VQELAANSFLDELRPRRVALAVALAAVAAVVVSLATVAPTLALADDEACISGRTWHDEVADATRADTELPVADVVVELLDDMDEVVRSAETGPGGDYRFTGLAAGTYRVRFAPPADTNLVAAGIGADPEVDSDPDPATGATGPITLTDGASATAIDAGLEGDVDEPTSGIGGFIWHDDDIDGLQGDCEAGYAGLSVELLADGESVELTVTDADGHYFLAIADSGTYTIHVHLPPLDDELIPQFSLAGQGSDPDRDSDVDFGGTAIVDFDGDGPNIAIDAGIHTIMVAPCGEGCEPPTTTVPNTTISPTTLPPPATVPPTVLPPTTGPATTAPPPACDDGQSLVGGECVPDPQLCEVDQTLVDGACVDGQTDQSAEQRWRDFRESLDEATLGVAQGCTPDPETGPPGAILCEGELDVPFHLTFELRPPEPDGPAPSGTLPDPPLEGATAQVETAFETRATLLFDPEEFDVSGVGVEVAAPGEARLSIPFTSDSSELKRFILVPKVAGSPRVSYVVTAVPPPDLGITDEREISAGTIQFTIVEAIIGDDAGSGGNIWFIVAAIVGLVLAGGAIAWARNRPASPDAATVVAAASAAALAGTHRVFISYSREDTARIQRLAAAIEEAGIRTWVDTGDIDAGEVWKEEIVRGIRSSDAVLLALSSTSVESNHVAAELSIGRSQDKPVLPVRLHAGIDLSDRLIYDLADLQHVDMYDDSAATINDVVEAVRRLVSSIDPS